MPPLLATSSGALYNLTDRWRTCKTTPSVVRKGGKIKISLSGGTWLELDNLHSRVGRKGGMVTISFARGKHMQFAVVLVIYDII